MCTSLKAGAYKANSGLKMSRSDLSQLLIKLSALRVRVCVCACVSVCVCKCDATTVSWILSLYLWSRSLPDLLPGPFSSYVTPPSWCLPRFQNKTSILRATVVMHRPRWPETIKYSRRLMVKSVNSKDILWYFWDGFKVVVLSLFIPLLSLPFYHFNCPKIEHQCRAFNFNLDLDHSAEGCNTSELDFLLLTKQCGRAAYLCKHGPCSVGPDASALCLGRESLRLYVWDCHGLPLFNVRTGALLSSNDALTHHTATPVVGMVIIFIDDA